MISQRRAAMALLTPFAAAFVGLVVACGTHLSSVSDAKLVNASRFAAFQLQDCSADAGACRASQIRVLATGIQCAVASVRADGKTGPVDAGPTCAAAGSAP